MALILTGCGSPYEIAYEKDSSVSSFNMLTSTQNNTFPAFASNLCVSSGDILSEDFTIEDQSAAGLFDVNQKEVLFSKNMSETLYPASLTKVMTALVALKYGNVDDILTATSNVTISEAGAQVINLKAGDTMTLNQALHILLIYSANDVANLIAEHVGGGSIDTFIQMMNDEAVALGATKTHFVNAHGLTDVNHYTTAYDIYLMFNEAIKYELFNEIIHMTNYETTYYDKAGEPKSFSCKTMNQFLLGNYTAPENITVIGGKTGTTDAAGHCLVLLARDTAGNPYIGIILRASTRDTINKEMISMLSEINK